ncbi:hypothetical protein ACYX7E_05600 [Luteimonas sp. RIT-PG2_3]
MLVIDIRTWKVVLVDCAKAGWTTPAAAIRTRLASSLDKDMLDKDMDISPTQVDPFDHAGMLLSAPIVALALRSIVA